MQSIAKAKSKYKSSIVSLPQLRLVCLPRTEASCSARSGCSIFSTRIGGGSWLCRREGMIVALDGSNNEIMDLNPNFVSFYRRFSQRQDFNRWRNQQRLHQPTEFFHHDAILMLDTWFFLISSFSNVLVELLID